MDPEKPKEEQGKEVVKKVKAKRSKGSEKVIKERKPKGLEKRANVIEKEEKEEKSAFGFGTKAVIGVSALVVVLIVLVYFSFFTGAKNTSPESETVLEEAYKAYSSWVDSSISAEDSEELQGIMDELKKCGGEYNRNFIIQSLVNDLINLGDNRGKFFGNIPKNITCGGVTYYYSLGIEDGLVTTSFLVYGDKIVEVKTRFEEGYIGTGVEVPFEDVRDGFYLIVYKSNGKLTYEYKKLDEFEPPMAETGVNENGSTV